MNTNEKFADIQILRYELKGFEGLSLQQKKLIYCLAQATLAGRDITTDQFGAYNLQIRTLLETIYLHYQGNREIADFQALMVYLKQVWFANGIYHHYNCQKFTPAFSEEFFRQLLQHPSVNSQIAALQYPIDTLVNVIFNPEVLPKRVEKSPKKDLVLNSACNYYEGVCQQEVEDFYQQQRSAWLKDHSEGEISYGLNSRVVKYDGRITEEIYRIGGRYSAAIQQIVKWLNRAQNYAETPEQQHIIQLLIEYYTTGDLSTFDQYSIAWVKDTTSQVDFINGFIEVYGDPLGLKGSWEGIVHYIDTAATQRTEIISQWAQWFEDNSPVNPAHKKKHVKGISARVVQAAMLGGDEYPSTAIGINLPNSDWIRAQHGSKSITISNLTHAYNEATRGNGFIDEFVDSEDMRELIKQYGDQTDDLHTDLHECVGHGSGQLLPGVASDALKAYADTIEEARADLFALYYMADEKLVELGLLPNLQAYKAQYYTYLMNGALTQLVRLKPGEQIEEAHMRNRALIAQWTLHHYPEAAKIQKINGKSELIISDFPRLREAFATLLTEIQRIKSEGDYATAQQLVEDYGITVDSELHKELLERYQKLNIKPYKGFINPRLIVEKDNQGNIVDIRADYTETYIEQMLRYSKEYGFLCYPHAAGNDTSSSDITISHQPSELVKAIHEHYRLHMNGVGAASMKQKGSTYAQNYGIPFTEIQAIAAEFQPNKALSEALWGENIRESKLLAILLMPSEEFNVEDIERWLAENPTVEIVEHAAKWLFSKAKGSKEWAQTQIPTTNGATLLAAIHTLTAIIIRTSSTDSDSFSSLQVPLNDLAGNHALPVYLRKAALNLLRRIE